MGYEALRKGRVSETHRAYLITTVTACRRPLFRDLTMARTVIRSMARLHEQGRVSSLAYVLMPDHLHWLFILRQGSLEKLMHALKGITAKRICRNQAISPPVWQPAFHDHAVQHEEDLRSIARYVVANPLRAGLVESVRHYPHWDAVWLEETLEG